MTWWTEMPYSTLLVMLISMGVSMISLTISRKFVKVETMQRFRKEMNEYNALMKEFRKTGDEKIGDKMKKRQQHVMQVQGMMFKQQLKMMAITFVPFMALFYVFNNWIFSPTLVVAIAPLNIPIIGREITFSYWYLLSALGFGQLVSKLMGYDLGA